MWSDKLYWEGKEIRLEGFGNRVKICLKMDVSLDSVLLSVFVLVVLLPLFQYFSRFSSKNHPLYS